MTEIHINIADAACASWGECVVKEMTTGLGYPDASVEGRVRRDGIGRTDRVMRDMVPRAVFWSDLDNHVHKGVMFMPGPLRRVVFEQYVEALTDQRAKQNHHSRDHWRRVREARVWMAGWLASRACDI